MEGNEDTLGVSEPMLKIVWADCIGQALDLVQTLPKLLTQFSLFSSAKGINIISPIL